MLDACRALRRLCLVAALVAHAPLVAQASECAAWPGEPRPLPRVGDRDPLRARWAELRAQELAQSALQLEAAAPVAAHRGWQRVLCLDPADEAARAGLARTRPLRVHRPEILADAFAEPPPFDTDVWKALDAPLGLVAPPSAAPEPPMQASPTPAQARAVARAASLRRIGRALDAAEGQLEAARFEETLASTAQARGEIKALAPGRDLAAPQLRLELAEATAEAARGRDDAARECFARALALEPGFTLDPGATSPKLLRLLEAARLGSGAAR